MKQDDTELDLQANHLDTKPNAKEPCSTCKREKEPRSTCGKIMLSQINKTVQKTERTLNYKESESSKDYEH